MQTKPTSSAQAAALRGRAKSELRDFAGNGMRGPVMSDLYRRAEAEQQARENRSRGKSLLERRQRGEHALAVAMRGIEDEEIPARMRYEAH